MSIGLRNVGKMLGEKPDVATCCKSHNINKWSFYKPVNYNSIKPLQYEQFGEVNDGFDLYNFSTPQEMVYELQNEDDVSLWDYIDRDAPYRLSDFMGYDHDGEAILETYWIGSDSGKAGDSLRFTSTTDIDSVIFSWAYYKQLTDYDFDYVLLIYPNGTQYSGGLQPIYVYKICNKLDTDGSGQFRFTIPSLLSDDDYECRLCLTNATLNMSSGSIVYDREGDLHGDWYAFPPHTKMTFTVDSSGGGGGGGGGGSTDNFSRLDYNYSDTYFSYNQNSMMLSDVTTTINFELLNEQTNVNYNISVQAYYDNAPSTVLLGSRNLVLNSLSPTGSMVFNYKDDIFTVVDDELPEGYINIRFVVSVTKLTVTQTSEWTVRLAREDIK